ncbi:MAG: hypothetical protein MZV64_35025 [Ignavibacteriales bacterium]|nr:hypothetical protein [Ignavibacteriales bacterium]
MVPIAAPPSRQRRLDLLQHVFADVADRPFEVEAEHHVQVGGRVRVNGEDAPRLVLGKVFDDHA